MIWNCIKRGFSGADKLNAKFAHITGWLEKGHQFQLFHMLCSCLRPTGDYFARLLFPDDAEPLMKRIDELVVRTKQACFGQDVSADGPLGPVGADLHQQQSEFPKRMNGIGLRSLFKKSQSVDFVGRARFLLHLSARPGRLLTSRVQCHVTNPNKWAIASD